jgi:hypothetical protein
MTAPTNEEMATAIDEAVADYAHAATRTGADMRLADLDALIKRLERLRAAAASLRSRAYVESIP